MDRRSFFRLMIGGVAAAAAVRTFPFRVFSFPSEIVIPQILPAGNHLLTIEMITKESLRILENELKFNKNVRRNFDEDFALPAARIGTILNIRKPMRYSEAMFG